MDDPKRVTRPQARGYEDSWLERGARERGRESASRRTPAPSGSAALADLRALLSRRANVRIEATYDKVGEGGALPTFDESEFEGATRAVDKAIGRVTSTWTASPAPPGSTVSPLSTGDILLPNDQPIGYVNGSAGPGIRTVTLNEFRRLQAELLNGAQVAATPLNYSGTWFQRSDGTVFGMRESSDNGITIDVIRSGNPHMPPGFKVHHE